MKKCNDAHRMMLELEDLNNITESNIIDNDYNKKDDSLDKIEENIEEAEKTVRNNTEFQDNKEANIENNNENNNKDNAENLKEEINDNKSFLEKEEDKTINNLAYIEKPEKKALEVPLEISIEITKDTIKTPNNKIELRYVSNNQELEDSECEDLDS